MLLREPMSGDLTTALAPGSCLPCVAEEDQRPFIKARLDACVLLMRQHAPTIGDALAPL